jgi:hypothetical protein
MAHDSGGVRLKLRLILGLVIVVLALGLAACGGGDDEGDDGNGGDNGDGAAATKTAEAEKTDTPEVAETEEPTQEPQKTEEPSGGGGGATLNDIPVYPGADKTGDWSGDDVPLPLFGGDVDIEDWQESAWATYETGDSVEDVADFYKGKMPDNGWEEEGWFDISFGEGAAWGNFTRDGGDSAAWVFASGTDGKTQIVIGAAHK